MADTQPTDGELNNLQQALTKLWKLDSNRLEPGRDYTINLTGPKLFENVDERVFEKPTFKAFVALLDNYTAQTGVPEVVTPYELAEDDNFIKAVIGTPPVQYAFQYLVAKGKTADNQDEFANYMKNLWFKLYPRERGVRPDSSSFEHTFLGEIKRGKAEAFHNWISFYRNEKEGHLKYGGYVTSHEDGRNFRKPTSNDHVIPIHFTYDGYPKKFSTSFVGTSPEFEIAMYTMLFLLGKQDSSFNVQDIDVGIKIYDFNYQQERLVGSAYPEILKYTPR